MSCRMPLMTGTPHGPLRVADSTCKQVEDGQCIMACCHQMHAQHRPSVHSP